MLQEHCGQARPEQGVPLEQCGRAPLRVRLKPWRTPGPAREWNLREWWPKDLCLRKSCLWKRGVGPPVPPQPLPEYPPAWAGLQ